jgi:ankyrin repeat protein
MRRARPFGSCTSDCCAPLLFAAAFGNTPMAKLPIDKGADIKLATYDGVTPRMIAHERGPAELETLLISNGATLNVVILVARKAVHAYLDAIASGMH